MMVKISPFGGILPRVGSRLLPDSGAQLANNVKLQSGEIKPLRATKVVNEPNKPLPALSIYRARYGEQAAWMTWPYDVDVVRVPLSSDVESRFVWTGDGQPRIATYSNVVSGGNNDYPKNSFALGIPAPATAPGASHSGGAGATTTRVYTYTFFSALGEESAPAPVTGLTTGRVDGTWAITGMAAFPPNSGDITALTYTGQSVTITTTNRHYNRVGEQITIAGVTSVTNVNGTWTLTAVNSAGTTMTFTVTGTPTGTYNNGTDVTDTWARVVSFNTTGMKRRLYRSTGLTGTVQLVADDVSTTYNDTLSDAQILGDELITSGWAQPPVGLQGVKVHPSGALVGFVGNLLCFSEPLQPHAWPVAYQLSTDRDIVGVGVFGSDIGVGTKGNPWLASGTEPASMTMEKVPGLYPCVSKRSIIGYGDGMIYASAHGLMLSSRTGVSLFTDAHFSKEEWEKINASTMVCASAYGRLYASYTRTDNSRSMLIFDGDLLTSADVLTYTLYADESTSELFLTDQEGVLAWDHPESYPLNASWWSKDFVLPPAVNIGAGKIEFDETIDPATRQAILDAITAAQTYNAALLATGNVGGAINSFGYNARYVLGSSLKAIPDNPPANEVTFILRKNQDEIVATRVVSNNRAFRLPSGYKADTYSVQVLSQCTVREIRIADTMDALRAG